MKKKFALILIVVISSAVYAQQLVVDGKANITVMDSEDAESSLVVVLPDGTLAQRDVSTLPVVPFGVSCRNLTTSSGGAFIGNPGSSKILAMFSGAVIPVQLVLLVEKNGGNALSGTLDVREIALGGPPDGFVFDTTRTNGLIGTWDFATDGLLNGGGVLARITINVSPTIGDAAWEISQSDVSNIGIVEMCFTYPPIGPTG